MLKLKLIDGIIREPLGGAHANPEQAFQTVKTVIKQHLAELIPLDPQKRIEKRIRKFANMGVYNE